MQNTPCQFTATPLTEGVAQLAEQHGILIEIEQAMLARVGIPPDVRCTLKVKKVTLGTALRKLLASVGLTYVVDSEQVVITARR